MSWRTAVTAALLALAACTPTGEPGAQEAESKTPGEKPAAGKAPEARTAPVRAAEVARMAPGDVRRQVKSGQALLVCAYESDSKFESVKLEDAIPFSRLKEMIPGLPKDQELIFYCN